VFSGEDVAIMGSLDIFGSQASGDGVGLGERK